MTRLRCALAALVVVGALGGCSDDDPEPNVDDPTPSVSSGPTESDSVSTSPTASPAKDPEATVRAWVDDWNEALATGDATRLRDYEADPCRGCDELFGPIEQIANAGGEFSGGTWTIDGLKVTDATSSTAEVSLGVDSEAGSTTPSAGAEPTPYPKAKHLFRLSLVQSGNQWLISVIEVLA
jgi:hypothetical protein